LVVVSALGAVSTPAFGQPASEPVPADPGLDETFQRGREALRTGRYAEACAAFEQSFRANPSDELRFNITLCSEQLGRFATAMMHHEALAQSASLPNAKRERAAEQALALANRVARLQISLRASTVPGLTLTLDGVPVIKLRDLPLDQGEHVVVASAPGFTTFTRSLRATKEAEQIKLVVELTREAVVPPPSTPMADARPSPRRSIGVALTIGGSATVVGGLVAGYLAHQRFDEANAVCGGGPTCRDPASLTEANRLVDQASLRGNISTGLVISGGVLVVGGLVMWLTAPEQGAPTMSLAPAVTATSAMLQLQRRF
jgi:hypothetical protein